jgi:hypothetical protein
MQNTSRILNYWHRVEILAKNGIVKASLLSALRHEYFQWREFLAQLREEARDYAKANQLSPIHVPSWVTLVDSLDALFESGGAS